MRTFAIILLCCISFSVCTAQTKELDAIFDLAEKHAEKQQWDKVFESAAEYCNKYGTSGPTFNYSKMVSYLAMQAARNRDYKEAIRLGEQVVEIRRAAKDCEPRHTANAINNLATYHFFTGKYNTAIELEEEVLKIYAEHGSKKDRQHAVAMYTMAGFLCARGEQEDYVRGAKYCEAAIGILKKNTDHYFNALNNLVVCQTMCNQSSSAEKNTKKLFKKGRKFYKTNLYSYAMALSAKSVTLSHLRAYSQALKYANEALLNFKASNSDNTPDCARLLMNMGVIYNSMDRYDESISVLKEAETIFAQKLGTENTDYIRCVSELENVYNKKGDRENIEYYEALLNNILSSRTGADTKSAKLIEKEAEAQAGKGSFEKAISYIQNAMVIYKDNNQTKSYANALNKAANYYICMRKYDEGREKAQEAVRMLQNVDVALMSDALGTVALASYYQNEVDSAIAYATRSIDLYRQIGDTTHTVYTKALSNLALYNYILGDTAKSISIAEQAHKCQIGILGEEHHDNVSMYYNLARFYLDYDNKLTQRYYHKALQLQTKIVRSNFTHMTTAEREHFWNTKKFLYRAAPTLVYKNQGSDTILADAYNAQLFTKGLLLNSEINFRGILHASGDSSLLNKFERLEVLQREIDASTRVRPGSIRHI